MFEGFIKYAQNSTQAYNNRTVYLGAIELNS